MEEILGDYAGEILGLIPYFPAFSGV